MFKNLKIRTKLLVGFGVVIIPMAAMLVFFFRGAGEVKSEVVNIIDVEVPVFRQLNGMKANLLESVEKAFAYTLLSAPAEKEGFFEQVSEFESLASQLKIIAYIGSPGLEEKTALFENIVKGHTELVNNMTIMFSDFEESGIVNVQLAESAEKSIDELVPMIDAFARIEGKEVDDAGLVVVQLLSEIEIVTMVVGIAVVLIALLFIVLISHSISRSVKAIRDASIEIAKGNMNVIIDPSGKDEIADLNRAINTMRESLKASRKKGKK